MWVLASWNVRTLLDVDGLIETGRQGDDMQVADEWKIDQVVDVLGRYRVYVAALQETKWFGRTSIELGSMSCWLLAGQSLDQGLQNRGGRVLPFYYLVPQLVLGKKVDVDGKPGTLDWWQLL